MKSRGRINAALAITLMAMILGGGNISALTDEEIFRDFRFNFINPGARALGLGGAFIAAADDATAAEANPAALHYINKMEIFAEFRFIEPETQSIVPSMNIQGVANFSELDFTTTTNREEDEIPTFVSFAYPFSIGKARTTVSFSRQVVLDIKSSLEDSTQGLDTSLLFSLDTFPIVCTADPNDPNLCTPQTYAISNVSNGTLDAELVNYNFGFSISVSQDLSLGGTATLSTLDMRSDVLSQAQDPRGILTSVNPRIDRGTMGQILLDDIQTRSTINDSDDAFAYALGLHWHPDSLFESGISPVRLGFVYRKGADLAVTQTIEEFDGTTQAFVLAEPAFANNLRVPDRYGIGFAYELGRHWVFALDGEYIEYSDLLKNFQAEKNFFTGGSIPLGNLNRDTMGDEPVIFDVDDATVVHAGVEYNVITKGKVNYAFRAGYFNAPDNRIAMTQFDSSDQDVNDLFLDIFRGGEDEDHYTVGFSIITALGLQFQFAGDFSDPEDQYLISSIYRFGKVRR